MTNLLVSRNFSHRKQWVLVAVVQRPVNVRCVVRAFILFSAIIIYSVPCSDSLRYKERLLLIFDSCQFSKITDVPCTFLYFFQN